MPNPENLTPWPKGQSGNPGGHSKGRRLRTALIKLFEEKLSLENEMMQTGIEQALGGEFNFWKYIIEMTDGKIPEPDPPAPEISMEEVAKRLKECKKAKRKAKE